MDEEQVDIIETQALQRILNRCVLLVHRRPELRRDEEVLAFDKAFAYSTGHGFAHGRFVEIAVGRINHAVTKANGFINRLFRLLEAQEERADAEKRCLYAIA